MERENRYLVFFIDEERYGIPISAVTKVIRAVELIHYPSKNGTLLGLINVMGEIIPVVNIRKQLRVREREMELNDRIIISRTSSRPVAFIVDRVEGIIDLSPEQMDILSTGNGIAGIGKYSGNTVKICDVAKFLTIQDLTEPGIDDPLPINNAIG